MKSKLTLLATLALTFGLIGCSKTPAESSTPAKDSSAPTSEKTPESSQTPASSETPVSSVPEETEEEKQAKAYNKLKTAYNNLDGYNQAYTLKSEANVTADMVLNIDGVSQTASTPMIYKEIKSYNPGSTYYKYSMEQEGLEKNVSTTLYEKNTDDGIEYRYTDSGKRSQLSDGHIDHIGVFDLNEAETFNLNTKDGFMKDFQAYIDYIVDDLEDMKDNMLETFGNFFVIPEFTQESYVSTLELGTEDGSDFVDINVQVPFTMNAATVAAGGKYAVTESSLAFNAEIKMTYTESFYQATYIGATYSLSGGDGTNTFSMSYDQKGSTAFATEFNTEYLPEKADSYTDAPITTTFIDFYTPEGMYISYKADTVDASMALTGLDYNSSITYDGFYLDKEMTQPISSITYKTYDQKIYTYPKAFDADKAAVRVYLYPDTEGTGDLTTYFKAMTIDENGQIDLSTFTGTLSGKEYTGNSILLYYTNDTRENIVDGVKLNASHDCYYDIKLYASQIPSVS